MTEWHVASPTRTDLGEAPFWDDVEECLWFVDIEGWGVHRLDPRTGEVSSRGMSQPVSAVIPTLDNSLVIACADGIHRYDWHHAKSELVLEVEPRDRTIHMNDAACDARGRLWAGTRAIDFRVGVSTLYRFDHHGAVPVLTERSLPNGIGWSPDGRTMYFADSQQRTILTLDYDLDTGQTANPRPWVKTPESGGFPDGLAVDASGDVWVALYHEGTIHRYDPSGTLAGVIELPVDRVTNVCFGGTDLRDLYITTSAQRRNADEAPQALAGSLLVIPQIATGQRSWRWNPDTMRTNR